MIIIYCNCIDGHSIHFYKICFFSLKFVRFISHFFPNDPHPNQKKGNHNTILIILYIVCFMSDKKGEWGKYTDKNESSLQQSFVI